MDLNNTMANRTWMHSCTNGRVGSNGEQHHSFCNGSHDLLRFVRGDATGSSLHSLTRTPARRRRAHHSASTSTATTGFGRRLRPDRPVATAASLSHTPPFAKCESIIPNSAHLSACVTHAAAPPGSFKTALCCNFNRAL